MTRTLLIAAALASAACGEVTERKDCGTSAECPAGEYCAHTSEGAVCWPDAIPPGVSVSSVVCGPAGCVGDGQAVRDGQLTVSAEVTDDAEVLEVEAWVDFDPEHAFALTRGSGTTWAGTLPLAALSFPAFAREAVVTVRARDGARNEASAVAPAEQRPVVTRVRWDYASTGQLSPPAVMSDGTSVYV